MSAKSLLREEYLEILEGKENKIMETGSWSQYVEDSGGELNSVTFFIEKSETGFLFVAQLTVSGINVLGDESEESILDDIEGMTDDMEEDFESVGLSSEDLEDFRIIIDRDDA